jgi:hypothetical protein
MPRSTVPKQLKQKITQDCAWRTMTDKKRRLLLVAAAGRSVDRAGRSVVRELLDSIGDPGPDCRAIVIILGGELVGGNGEIKNLAKSVFGSRAFMRPEAEHPNFPCPVMKVIPGISNFSLNRP